jgi:lipopolysaccharide export system permease protein
MKLNTILNRHLLREFLPPFAINLVFFTFIFLMAKILQITRMVVNYKVGLSKVFLLLVYWTPYFLIYVIPMSVMMSILLTFLKMTNENEIIALKASGISPVNILPPVVLFSVFGCLLTLYMSFFAMPWGRRAFLNTAAEVAVSYLEVGIKERTFNNHFKKVMLYVHEVDPGDRSLKHVFIEDRQINNVVSTIVAPRGKLFKNPETFSYRLRLFDGTINQVDLKKKKINAITFDTYDVSLDLKKAMADTKNRKRKLDELSVGEMREYIDTLPPQSKKYFKAKVEYHRRFSIPIACLALGLLAVPLGMQTKSARKSYGLILGMIFFFLYFILLSAGMVFGESGAYPPVVGMWLPNLIMGCLGAYLLFRLLKERSFDLTAISRLIQFFKKAAMDKYKAS